MLVLERSSAGVVGDSSSARLVVEMLAERLGERPVIERVGVELSVVRSGVEEPASVDDSEDTTWISRKTTATVVFILLALEDFTTKDIIMAYVRQHCNQLALNKGRLCGV